MATQIPLIPNTKSFGGQATSKANPRDKRPLSSKHPLHLVLKASVARGQYSMLKPTVSRRIEATIHKFAHRFGVRIYRYQNVGNHLHLVVLIRSRSDWRAFIRAVTSRIRQGLEKTWGVRFGRFWDWRPFTRVLSWGRDFRGVMDYMLKNLLDACGLPRTKENLLAVRRLAAMGGGRKEKPRSCRSSGPGLFVFY